MNKTEQNQILVEYQGDEGMIFMWVNQETFQKFEVQDRKFLSKLPGTKKFALLILIIAFNFPSRVAAESKGQNSPMELQIVPYKKQSDVKIVPYRPHVMTVAILTVLKSNEKNSLRLNGNQKDLRINYFKPQPLMIEDVVKRNTLAQNNYIELKKELLLPQTFRRSGMQPPVTLKLRGGVTNINSITNWGIKKAEIILLGTEKIDVQTKIILLTNPAVWLGMSIVSYRLSVDNLKLLINKKQVLPTFVDFVKKNPAKLILSTIVLANTRSLFRLVTSQASRTELISGINRLVDDLTLKIWGTPQICDSTNFVEKIKILETELNLFRYKAENRLKVIALKNAEIELQKKEILEVRIESQERVTKIKDKMEKILKDSRLPENYESKVKDFTNPLLNSNEPSGAGKIHQPKKEKQIAKTKTKLNNKEPGRSTILKENYENGNGQKTEK